MQPSRLFNAGAMHEAELMREVAAMRLAGQALQSPAPRVRRFSPVGSLAFTIASWRRLSARRLFAGGSDVITSPPQVRRA